MNETKFTPKQQKFIDEYLVDLNATKAAIRAGYSAKTAYQAGSRLLTKVEIQEALRKKQQKREKKTEITAERVLKQLANMAFFDSRSIMGEGGNILPVNEWPDEAATAGVAGIEVVEIKDKNGRTVGQTKKIKITDRRGPLQDLAKHLGICAENLNVKVEDVTKLTPAERARRAQSILAQARSKK